ncbi:MAG: protein translocase subunit SecD [Candidatus Binatia bacterium]
MWDVAFAQTAQAPSGPPVYGQIFVIGAIFVIFYLLLVRPQQRKAKEHREMLAKLKKNDKVITSGGIYGRIVALTESELTLEIAPNVRIRVQRSYISQLERTEKVPGRRSKRSDMPRGLVARFVGLLVLTCAAMIYLFPAFVTQLPSWWGVVFPTEGIHLGLDLQGGTHLILEVRVDKAVENTLDRVRGDLRTLLRERAIPFLELERVQGGRILLKLPSESAQRVRDLIKEDYPNLVLVSSHSGAEGIELLLGLHERELRSIRDDTVDQSLETIRNRIDQFGVREPTIQRRGQHDILVQLPGLQDAERAKELIGKTALLEFKLLDEINDVDEAVRKGPPPGREILYGYVSRGDGGLGAEKVPYLLEARTLMTGDYIKDARVRPGDQLEGPYVELILNTGGARLFDRITGENVRRRLAIILDNRVYSAPVIQERISGGRASITGSFDFKEARDLAIVLRAGALPAPVEIVEERTVGPSLGRDSIRQGIISFIIGGSLLLLFMFAYYKGAGLLADVALAFNILFMMAILAGFEAVLTLPGIGGIILTMGMAVDANVLINERIREEVRSGKSPRAAVDAGYERALPAILDSNITTFLAGVILFQFGTGPVKGFAVTLCVGIFTTVLTAVYGTRIYYDYRIAARKLTRLSV